MPPFIKPKFPYTFDLSTEVRALRKYRQKESRYIPEKSDKTLLLATWNIANLGLQDREDNHYHLLAEVVSWFDVIAVQEVNDDLSGLRAIKSKLPKNFRLLFSDRGGNNERMAFIYDSSKIQPMEKIGELALSPEEYEDVKLPGVSTKFEGYDRSPFIGSFQAEDFEFLLVNVHLYFGSETESASMERRCLETYGVARWADLRRKSKNAYTPNIIALGDFNLPKVEPGDPVFKALTSRGLVLPDHSTKVFSNIVNDKEYDQISFVPGMRKFLTGNSGVFDFDGAVFKSLYESRSNKDFLAYLRYYMSDHRPMWIEIDLTKSA